MDLDKFIKKNEFLYHLTDSRNFEIIKIDWLLLSTESLVNKSTLNIEEKKKFLTNKRPVHKEIVINGKNHFIRDQKPISETNLKKCLTNGWSVGEFLQLLNSRVFFWPSLPRLWSHFTRYQNESPIIIKVSSGSMFEINNHAEFCRLNSGATRSNSHLNGAPPDRGIETFLPAEKYLLYPGSVAEVTFPNSCILPKKIYIGKTPNGPWNELTLP
jgi:hypothetical protein